MANSEQNNFTGEIVLYEAEDGSARIQCRFVDDDLWLTQALIADLFGITVPTVNEHLKSIFEDGELDSGATIRKFRIVRLEGERQVSRTIDHYNLEAILAVGYRVRSNRGAQFRRWATDRLSDYLVKGFAIDDQRLKAAPGDQPDHFEELLERIRDIRASEARVYLRVREIFALAADYDTKSDHTNLFFKKMQNKLHFATAHQTAAEIIKRRADHTLPNMGLTSFAGDHMRKSDVTVAKNYLTEDEISGLNRIVTMWLDYAEDQSQQRKTILMADWETKLDQFLEFNDRNVLKNAGTVKTKDAHNHARSEYDLYKAEQRTLAEKQGAADQIKALEEIAKRKRNED